MICLSLICSVLFPTVLSQVQVPDAPSIPTTTGQISLPTSFLNAQEFEKEFNKTFTDLKTLNDSLTELANSTQVDIKEVGKTIADLWKSLFIDPLIYASLIRKEYCPGITPQTDSTILLLNDQAISWLIAY